MSNSHLDKTALIPKVNATTMDETTAKTAVPKTEASVVPWPVTIGLFVFGVLLVLLKAFLEPSGYSFWQMLVWFFVLHLVVVPAFFLIGAWLMNRFLHENILPRNALTLGLLVGIVWILWSMSV